MTSYLGSFRAFSCSKHMPKSILRFAIQPRATFLASSRPSGSYPETLDLHRKRTDATVSVSFDFRSSLSIQTFEGSRFVRGGRYGISIDFSLEVVEKESTCRTTLKSKFIDLTNEAQQSGFVQTGFGEGNGKRFRADSRETLPYKIREELRDPLRVGGRCSRPRCVLEQAIPQGTYRYRSGIL